MNRNVAKLLGPGPWLLKTALMLALADTGVWHGHAAAQAPSTHPDSSGQAMLIKNTLAALNHGNITGNYTVLRDLASERFRKQNTAGDLADTFANLRQKKHDLSPILITEPRLTQPPSTDQHHRLQLVGYVPTRPQAVRFALVFQQTAAGWVIDEVTVGIAPIESVVQTQRPPQSSPSAAHALGPRTAARPQPAARDRRLGGYR